MAENRILLGNVGLTARGTWSASYSYTDVDGNTVQGYETGDTVVYNNSLYESLQDGNTEEPSGATTAKWRLDIDGSALAAADANEQARQNAEAQRESAESKRQSDFEAAEAQRTADYSSKQAEMDAAVKTVQDKATASETQIQELSDSSKATIQSLVNALPVTQTTGDSETSVMSQKAVSDYVSKFNSAALNTSELSATIGGTSAAIALKGNYSVNIFWNYTANSSCMMYVGFIHKGETVTMTGTSKTPYLSMGYTTTDLTGKTIEEIAALKLKPNILYRDQPNDDANVLTWEATTDCWVICFNAATQPAPLIKSTNKFDALKNQSETNKNDIISLVDNDNKIKEILNGGTPIDTFTEDTTKIYDNKTYSGFYFHAILDGADSIDVTLNENSSSTNHELNISADGWYKISCNSYKVYFVKAVFNGSKGKDTKLELYDEDYQGRLKCATEIAEETRRYVFRKQTISQNLGGALICYKYVASDYRDNPPFPKYTFLKVRCTSIGKATGYTVTAVNRNGTRHTFVTNSTEVGKDFCWVADGDATIIRIACTGDAGVGTVFEVEIGEPVYDIAEQNREDIMSFRDSWLSGHENAIEDGFDFTKLLNRVYCSGKTASNTEATLKRISKTAYGYAHVSLMEIADGTVYMMHMQNSNYGDGEKNTSTGYELVLDYFSLDRYESSDFDCDKDVTTVLLGKIGTQYTDASTGTSYSGVRAPGDGSLKLVGNILYIVHPIRPANNDDETVISYQFDTTTKSISDNTTNVCKLVYNDTTYDFTTANVKEILQNAGCYTNGMTSLNISSNFVMRNNIYYNVIAGAGECCGALVSTTDFITFTVVAIAKWNIKGADEIMLMSTGDNILMAARQMYGVSHIKIGIYSFRSNSFSSYYMLPAVNSRPYLWINGYSTYIIYPILDGSYRSLWQICSSTNGNGWQYVCTLSKQWDYPCVCMYNSNMYFSASTNSRRQIVFGKLQITGKNVLDKFIKLIDNA